MPARSPAGRYTDWSTPRAAVGGGCYRTSVTSYSERKLELSAGTPGRMRPAPHVLDHLGRDLLLGQVEREHGLTPSLAQPIHIELGHVQELALRGERTAGDQRMDVRFSSYG
jgi:hypothetical protein